MVPFNQVTSTDDPEKLKSAKTHLQTALKLYGEALTLEPDNLWSQLGRAWLLTQTERKTDAIEPLRHVCEKGWASDQKAPGFFGGFLGIAAEASGYLIPLLDPLKDGEEIARYRARIEHMKTLPRAMTPIVVPLRSGLDASDVEDRAARVQFDVDGSGLSQKWSWITPDGAWLVHDPRRSGKIRSGLQLFGSVTFWLFWETGYEALAALDDDGDGRLEGKELDGLALWRDLDADGVSDAGEVRPLGDWGVVAISCRGERDPGLSNCIAWSPRGVTFEDGTVRPTYDLILQSGQRIAGLPDAEARRRGLQNAAPITVDTVRITRLATPADPR